MQGESSLMCFEAKNHKALKTFWEFNGSLTYWIYPMTWIALSVYNCKTTMLQLVVGNFDDSNFDGSRFWSRFLFFPTSSSYYSLLRKIHGWYFDIFLKVILSKVKWNQIVDSELFATVNLEHLIFFSETQNC